MYCLISVLSVQRHVAVMYQIKHQQKCCSVSAVNYLSYCYSCQKKAATGSKQVHDTSIQLYYLSVLKYIYARKELAMTMKIVLPI